MTQGSGASAGPASTVASVLGAVAAGVVAAGALALAAFARVDGSATIAWAAIGALFVVLAVGLVRRWILAALLALVLGGAGVVVGLLGVLSAGDAVYDRVQQAPDLVFPLLAVVVSAVLAVGGAAGVPPTGGIGRWAAGLIAVVGIALGALGVGWLLEVQEQPNPTPLAANPTWDCGSAYSPGSVSDRPDSGCGKALDTARHGGRIALALGSTMVLLGTAVLVGQIGWRRSWPFVSLGAGVAAVGVVVWFVFLPLDGGRCASVYDGSEGTTCDSMAGAVSRLATLFAVAAPVLLVTGLVGLGMGLARAMKGPGTRVQVSA